MPKIYCPSCGRPGELSTANSFASNDDEHHVILSAPEGFRKISVSSHSSSVYLYCISCTVAALIEGDPQS